MSREFITTRAELFERLVLAVPSGYTVTQGEYGPGRKYHLAVGDLLDAFWEFCDEKELAQLGAQADSLMREGTVADLQETGK